MSTCCQPLTKNAMPVIPRSQFTHRDFNPLNFNVYNKMKGDIMKSSKSDLELLLDHYRVSKCVAITFQEKKDRMSCRNIPTRQVLIYDGTMDIITNHPSQVSLFENMNTWEGRDLYSKAKTEVSMNIMCGHFVFLFHL